MELLDIGFGKYVIVFVGIIFIIECILRYVVGVYFFMLILFFEGGEMVFLEGSGLFVGLFEILIWEVYEVFFDKLFCLILFLDGILEVIEVKSFDEKEWILFEFVLGGCYIIVFLSEVLNFDEIMELLDDIVIVLVIDSIMGLVNRLLK